MSRLFILSVALAFTPAVAAAQPADPPPDDDQGDGDGDGDSGDGDGDANGGDAKTGADKGATGDKEADAPASDVPDVDDLRRRYFELRDKLFRSRARAASVATALYSTRVRVNLDYGSGRHYTVTRATIRLDGANVFDDTEGKITSDNAIRFEGYIAPGRHQITIRIEATGKDDDRITTASETTLSVLAPAGKDLVVEARAADGGDMAYKWQRKTKGNYRLRLDVDVKSVERKDGGKRGAIKRG